LIAASRRASRGGRDQTDSGPLLGRSQQIRAAGLVTVGIAAAGQCDFFTISTFYLDIDFLLCFASQPLDPRLGLEEKYVICMRAPGSRTTSPLMDVPQRQEDWRTSNHEKTETNDVEDNGMAPTTAR